MPILSWWLAKVRVDGSKLPINALLTSSVNHSLPWGPDVTAAG